MPFKSKAQHRRFQEMAERGEISWEKVREWEAATPDLHNLPERIGPKKSKTAATPKGKTTYRKGNR